MSQKRNITEKDIYLKARILSEGVQMSDEDMVKAFRRENLFGIIAASIPVSS